MPVCLKCGWELVYGPAGCACTQAARHERRMEEAARVGEELAKRLKMVTTKKGKNLTQALIQQEHRDLEARRDQLRLQQDRLLADFRALQRKCKHPKLRKYSAMGEIGDVCDDCGYQT